MSSDDEAMFASAVAEQPTMKNSLAHEIQNTVTSQPSIEKTSTESPKPEISNSTEPFTNVLTVSQQEPVPSLKNPLTITIQEAEKRVASMESYISYQIVTTGAYSATVRRRFNDFRWLHDQLRVVFPYHFLPPLPQKIVLSVDRFAPDFVESRRTALQVYLKTIAEHCVVSNSQTFQQFLTNQSTFKTDSLQEVSKITGGLSGFGKLAKGLSQAFSTKTREPEFNDIVNYVDLYKDRVSYAGRVAHRIINETVDAGENGKNMILKFKQWRDYEAEFGIKVENKDEKCGENCDENGDKNTYSQDLSKMLNSYCTASEKLADIYTPSERYFRVEMQPYLELQERFCDEVSFSLKNRDNAQFDLEKCKENSKSKQMEQQINNTAYGYNHTDSMSKAKLEHDMKTLEDKEKQLFNEKLAADKIVRQEIGLWNDSKDEKLKSLFRYMAKENMDLADKQIEIYEGLLAEFENSCK